MIPLVIQRDACNDMGRWQLIRPEMLMTMLQTYGKIRYTECGI